MDAIKSENKLISTIQEQQLKTEIELDKENLDYMLIELDDLQPDFLNLVLDILEHYEMYRLCILICQRYKFTNKIGKYVLAIC